jgi:ABC-type uncharacterized transport system substrate-binding protein
MKASQNRRQFLRLSAAGTLGMVVLSPMACTSVTAVDKKSYGVGLQLYTIRDAMDEDLKGSLQKLSDLGYKNLELASYSN